MSSCSKKSSWQPGLEIPVKSVGQAEDSWGGWEEKEVGRKSSGSVGEEVYMA